MEKKTTMQSIVKVFDQSEIRFVDHPEGKFDFGIVAEDMAMVLDASSGKDLARSVDEEWKGVQTMLTPGGNQSVTVIWEPGIYQVLAKSRKPQAKPFQKWVFEEVLPSIRKTGKYEPNNAPVEVKRVLPTHTAVEYAHAAAEVSKLKDGILKQLVYDALVDELSLSQNLKYLPVAEKPKQYTIVKVRAKSLGYTESQIGDGTQLGRFIKARLEPAFQEMIGRFPVYHYEINPDLDDAIHQFFS